MNSDRAKIQNRKISFLTDMRLIKKHRSGSARAHTNIKKISKGIRKRSDRKARTNSRKRKTRRNAGRKDKAKQPIARSA